MLFGPPGAGKGTQAELLSEKLNLYYLETSKIIEANINTAKEGDFVEVDGQKFFLSNEKNLWLSGKLNSPPVVTFWVIQKIKELSKEGKGIVMAGSPRTVYEAEREIPILIDNYGRDAIAAVLIEISPEETLFRNSNRRICELMRHPIIFTEETKKLTICPLDGSKLIRREGLDDPETIKVRLKEYKERTFPLIEVLERHGVEIKNINGEQTVEAVFNDILKAL